MACLTLVAPAGMSAEDRQAWVAVAKQTLTGMPTDLLARGCRKARETCRFPSEIVPTILAEVQDTWTWRKRRLMEERRNAPRLEQHEAEAVPHEVTQAIIREAFGGRA